MVSPDRCQVVVGHGDPVPIEVSESGIERARRRRDLYALLEIANKAREEGNASIEMQALLATDEIGKICDEDFCRIQARRAEILRQSGKTIEALHMLNPIVEQYPDHIMARRTLASFLLDISHEEEAIDHLMWICRNSFVDPVHWVVLGMAFESVGRRADAEYALRRALALDPDCVEARAAWPMVALERVPSSVADHDESIERFLRHVEETRAWVAADPSKRRPALAKTFKVFGPFAASYYPGDITHALRAWGDLAGDLFPEHRPFAWDANRKKIKLGIFSRHFYRHSVFSILIHGIISNIDRERFEISCFSEVATQDDQTEEVKSKVDHWHDRRDPDLWPALLSEVCPDILFYPDTTMNPISVWLAMQRLAPLQATTWGHPVSSGLRTVDMFFTGDLMEGGEAQSHYVESLVRLSGTGACTPLPTVDPAPLPEEAKRILAEGRPVAVVPCNAFKLAPADDGLWVEIAKRNPDLKIVFFRNNHQGKKGWYSIERIKRAFQDNGLEFERHACSIDFLPSREFNSFMRHADIYLDVPTFSGYTTAWQGCFAGIPIVTQEGRFLRQRLAAGLLRLIGRTETIARTREEYVDIVSMLVSERRHDPEAFAARRADIQAAAPSCCGDTRPVREMERAFLEGLAERGDPLARRFLAEDAAHRASSAPVPQKSAFGIHLGGGNEAWTMLDDDLSLSIGDGPLVAPDELLGLLPDRPRRICEARCFDGALGARLKERHPDSSIIGIHPLPGGLGSVARGSYDAVHGERLEEVDWTKYPSHFDSFIASGALERSVHPWRALQRIRLMMRRDGVLVAVVPNARNLMMLASLLDGEFEHAKGGWPDIRHVRLFTPKSARKMLERTGFCVEKVILKQDENLIHALGSKNIDHVKKINLGPLTISIEDGDNARELVSSHLVVVARAI